MLMGDDRIMRTILDIDEDVLETAKELAARHGTTAGPVNRAGAECACAPRRQRQEATWRASAADSKTGGTSHS